MTTDSPTSNASAAASQPQLASGEAVFARWSHLPLQSGMLSKQLWLRGELGAMQVVDRPSSAPPQQASGRDGAAKWWLPEGDRCEALLALLPDLMPLLPLGVEASNKLQVAERMAYPRWAYAHRDWNRDDGPAERPFVDAVFVDDAAHLHLVDVALGGQEGFRTFHAWQLAVQERNLYRYWLHRSEPGSRFQGEYDKVCWQRHRSPLEGVLALIDSHGDEMPNRTVEAFWDWVGRRCTTYWDIEVPYERRMSPHCILVTDASVPVDEHLRAPSPHGNLTLACVTPFVLDGATWLRVDVRSWAEAMAETLLPSPNRICRMAGATDVGKQREANQDALLWSEEDGWAAVADGMGGHPNGDVASATVLRVFAEAMRQWPDGPHRRRTVAQRLRRAAAQAHAELWKDNEGKSIFGRMGTTLSAIRLHGDELSLVHAGDSRIYEYSWGRYNRAPGLRRLTTDHGQGSGLDRAVGLWERMPFDIDTMPIANDAMYVLCSDGLTNMVDDATIATLCAKHIGIGEAPTNLEGLVSALIDAANEAGGRDNITVCAVDAGKRPEQPVPVET